jgi:membrane protein implicated in regulation of membrane protease activity
MVVLGLLLILVAVGAAVVLAMAPAATSQVIDLSVLDVTATPLGVFIAGALSVVLFGLGLTLIRRGARRSARKRKELKQLRRENVDAATTRAADRERAGADDSTRQGSNNDLSASTDKGPEQHQDNTADNGAADPGSDGTETPPER